MCVFISMFVYECVIMHLQNACVGPVGNACTFAVVYVCMYVCVLNFKLLHCHIHIMNNKYVCVFVCAFLLFTSAAAWADVSGKGMKAKFLPFSPQRLISFLQSSLTSPYSSHTRHEQERLRDRLPGYTNISKVAIGEQVNCFSS